MVMNYLAIAIFDFFSEYCGGEIIQYHWFLWRLPFAISKKIYQELSEYRYWLHNRFMSIVFVGVVYFIVEICNTTGCPGGGNSNFEIGIPARTTPTIGIIKE